MKKLLWILPMLLVGCAAPLETRKAESNVMAAATLAYANSCEVDVAADYTSLIMSRQRATKALQSKRITIEQAKQVQALADHARVNLDAACPNRRSTLDVSRHRAAQATLAEIAKILEKRS